MMEPNKNNDENAVDAAFDDGAAEILNDADHDNGDDDDEEEEGEEEDDDDEEEEEEEEEDVLDPVKINRLYDKVAAVIQQRDNLPLRTRTNMVRFAHQFLNNVRNDIHYMITDTRTEEEGYRGLDSERDTEAEVSTA